MPPAPFRLVPGAEATDLIALVQLCESHPQDAHRHLLDGKLAEWLRAAGYPGPAYLADGLRVSGLPVLSCVAQFVDGCRPFLAAPPGPAAGPMVAPAVADPAAAEPPGNNLNEPTAPVESASGRAWRWGSEGSRVGGTAGVIGLAGGACAVQALYWLMGGWGPGLPASPAVIVLFVGAGAALAGSLLGAAAGAVTGAVMAVDKPDGPDPPLTWIFKSVLTACAVLGLLGGWMVARSLSRPADEQKRERVIAGYNVYLIQRQWFWEGYELYRAEKDPALRAVRLGQCRKDLEVVDPFQPVGVDGRLAEAIAAWKKAGLEFIDALRDEPGRRREPERVAEAMKRFEAAQGKVEAVLNQIAAEVGGIEKRPPPAPAKAGDQRKDR